MNHHSGYFVRMHRSCVNHPAQAKQFRQIKLLWKLLLKPEGKLEKFDYLTKWRNFDYRQLSEADVLRRYLQYLTSQAWVMNIFKAY